MPDWNSLPKEIRDRILGYFVALDRIAKYAHISREWRDAIEKKVFQRLQINHSNDFLGLERLNNRHKSLVKHIWLNIELESYTCDDCGWLETLDRNHANKQTIKANVTSLLDILSFWPAQQDLTLEINAYSPSDSQHWLQGHYFGVPGEDLEPLEDVRPFSSHGFVKYPFPPVESLERPRHPVIDALDLKPLAEVKAVTKFLIRRQCRRRFNPTALGEILSKLPRLEKIIHEEWYLPDPDDREIDWANDYANNVLTNYKNVKSITVFEDFNELHYPVIFNWLHDLGTPLTIGPSDRPDSKSLAAPFARRSLGLENLSVSFMVDASDFFGACQSDWQWKHLRSLTLTSRALSAWTAWDAPEDINLLLKTAAKTAMRMPKLTSLTLWNGASGEACAFTYRRHQESASVTWQTAWWTKLHPEVFKAWNQVACQHSVPWCSFKVENKETIPLSKIKSHGDAICYLGLDHVVDAVSLKQIRLENKIPWYEA